jgi:hypothetical protein
LIVHFLSLFPDTARINGYTSDWPTDAQGLGRQDWAIIERQTDNRNATYAVIRTTETLVQFQQQTEPS